MPGPLAVAAVAGGAQILNSGINAGFQGRMNRKNRKFAREQALQARGWALEDYERENAYNSPEAQMARYKAAGLNPHLIYGQSNEGASVRSTPAAQFEGQAPTFDLDAGPVVQAYNSTRLADIQTNNAKAQYDILVQEYELKKAQTADTLASVQQKGVNTDRQLFDLGFESELRPYSLEARKGALFKQQAEIKQIDTNTQYTLDHNQREQIKQASDLRQAVATLANTAAQTAKTEDERRRIQQEVRNLHLDESLKADELHLRAQGLTPSSPTYQKVVGKHLEKIIEGYRKARDFRDKWANPRINWFKK